MAQTGGAVEYLDSLKCGGRVKKAKKKEEGGEMTKSRIKTSRLAKGAKAPCPCSLKRIGGTIVEVDCEGNVVSSKFGKGGRIFSNAQLTHSTEIKTELQTDSSPQQNTQSGWLNKFN